MVEENAASGQHLKGDEGEATGNEDRHGVKSYSLSQEIGNFGAIWVEPLADVLGFYGGPTGVGVSDEKIQTLVPGEAPSAESLWRLLLRIENAVVVLCKVWKVAEVIQGVLAKECLIDCDFEALALAESQIAALKTLEYW